MKKTIITIAVLSILTASAFAQNLPAIKITSKSGNSDFASKPVATVVTEARKTWGEFRDDPAPYYEECLITTTNEYKSDELSDISAKVKVRGNWTTSYDKKPLRIRFSEKQSVLGLNKGRKNKDWVLLNSYKDWSFMRDWTGLNFANLISDYYASDSKLVEVYINDEFWGVYVLAELQEVCNDRINITEPKKDYKGTDIGYLLEFDGYAYAEKNSFEIQYGGMLKDANKESVNISTKGYTVKSEINSPEQLKFISSYMNNLWKICYQAVYRNKFQEFDAKKKKLVKSTATNAYDCVSKVIDIDSLVDAYIIAEVACDPDIYYSSFYMDIDFGENGNGLLTFEAPWDFDSCFGNKNFCADAKGIYAGNKTWDVNHVDKIHGNPWMLIFVNCDWFQKAVKAKWRKIQKQNTLLKLTSEIDYISSNFEASFANDQKKWNNIGDNELVGNELCDESAKCKTQKEAADRLKDWLTARFEYLDSVWGK